MHGMCAFLRRQNGMSSTSMFVSSFSHIGAGDEILLCYEAQRLLAFTELVGGAFPPQCCMCDSPMCVSEIYQRVMNGNHTKEDLMFLFTKTKNDTECLAVNYGMIRAYNECVLDLGTESEHFDKAQWLSARCAIELAMKRDRKSEWIESHEHVDDDELRGLVEDVREFRLRGVPVYERDMIDESE